MSYTREKIEAAGRALLNTSGYSCIKTDTAYIVTGGSRPYTVTLTPTQCDCTCFQLRGYCKHVTAIIRLVNGLETPEEARARRRAEFKHKYDAELRALYGCEETP